LLAEPESRAVEKGNSLLRAALVGQPHRVPGGRVPVVARLAELREQLGVARARDERARVVAETPRRLRDARLEGGPRARAPLRVRGEEIVADVDAELLLLPGDVPERREAPDLRLRDEPAPRFDPGQLDPGEGSEHDEDDERNGEEKGQSP